MKRVVSVSLGSASRDYAITVNLLGEEVHIERIGTDGDVSLARSLYQRLDGQVDCLGVGGAVLSLDGFGRSLPITSVARLVADVRHTPVVDGTAFKAVMEGRIAEFLARELPDAAPHRRVLVTSAVDRAGMALSFASAGYEVVYGDLIFVLGLPFPLKTVGALRRAVGLLGPVVRHLPMRMLYPTGRREDVNVPRYGRWFRWADIVAGDCNYITRYMPKDMAGKTVVTNTTTARDVELFRERGVRYLVTSTPRLGERTFGTNVMEGVLVALAAKGRALERDEVAEMLRRVGWQPHVECLN